MKYETIKVGNKIYNIAKGSCSLNNLSGYTPRSLSSSDQMR